MTEEEFDDLQMKMNSVKENIEQLTPWERSFIEDQFVRIEEYGPRVRFSEKQQDIVDRICDKCALT